MVEKTIALVPNAHNSAAEAIRDRTRCRLCRERIESGQEIYDLSNEAEWDIVHAVCYDAIDGEDGAMV